MTLWPSRTQWGWFRTSITDDADARHADVYLAILLSLRDTWKMLFMSRQGLNVNIHLPSTGLAVF